MIIIKILKFIVQKIVFSAFLLYGYNLISVQFNMIIPINYCTIFIVSCLGSTGLAGLAFFKYFIL